MWAFGTSPHGLGLPSRRFWLLNRREYYALRRVYLLAHGVKDEDAGEQPAAPRGWPVQPVEEKKLMLKTALDTAAIRARKHRQALETANARVNEPPKLKKVRRG